MSLYKYEQDRKENKIVFTFDFAGAIAVVYEFGDRCEESAAVGTRGHLLLRVVPHVFGEAVLAGENLLTFAPHALCLLMSVGKVFGLERGHVLETYVSVEQLGVVCFVDTREP